MGLVESKTFHSVFTIDHPVINDRLARLRNKDTTSADFKKYLHEISLLMTYEVSNHLSESMAQIETPLETIDHKVLKNGDPVIVPILRAGLGLSDGVKDILSASEIGHIGVYRDEKTKLPKEYLVRLPQGLDKKDIIVTDPMLATGNSLCHAIEILVQKGADLDSISCMILLAAPEGLEKVKSVYPSVRIYTAAIDRCLNENAFIVPGLGDAGDRLFGT
ncbi:MAG: uracil phosphoribosyltransferase [Pseudomonadota bacterium]